MVIRAIKTEYKGVLFMSTLEADWAKTLDGPDFRMPWQNEPEGLKLPDGQNYRPDLYLPRLHTWVEVKGPHDQRIDKPARLAEACLHAPGCETYEPVKKLVRPAKAPKSGCPCGYGPDFPFENVVIARPATGAKAVWEAPMGIDQKIVVMVCIVCKQRSFTDAHGAPICRRCHSNAAGSSMYPSGSFLFRRVEPPRGRKQSSAAGARARKAAR